MMERQDPATQAGSELYSETYTYAATSNRLANVVRTRTTGGTTVPLRHRSFAYDDRGNIKTDTRSKTVNGTTTTDVLVVG